MDELEIQKRIEFIAEQGLNLDARNGRYREIILGVLRGETYREIAVLLIPVLPNLLALAIPLIKSLSIPVLIIPRALSIPKNDPVL